jgi:hypothetical protein
MTTRHLKITSFVLLILCGVMLALLRASCDATDRWKDYCRDVCSPYQPDWRHSYELNQECTCSDRVLHRTKGREQ